MIEINRMISFSKWLHILLEQLENKYDKMSLQLFEDAHVKMSVS